MSSEYRFTDGNLIVLYAVHKGRSADGGLPDYIQERVKLGLETYSMVMRSRPDKHKTMVMIVGEQEPAEKVKEALVQGGVKPDIIAIDTDSQNMAQTIDRIAGMIKSKPNPPFVYFVGSVWLHDIFDSTVVSKLKGYRIQFYGALDHRPVDEVEKEKALDVPKKGIEYYKQKAKNKAVDVLLNIIFPD
ncbi:MAG: hypothetical protein QXX64_03915 [Nitrososphaera sp.]|uniref:Uncharacterized protein n=1 Tax=Nitrososphaera gargensis (strain Ga9.2) TaxID=1237085 RepID=K0IFW4_NITGG|nr:hypothetical protein [Candidatus Nitrososphaera gargensis]AFU57703.1 hypothetical protein Ngar_c07610 [Candidatus Nitrososphaera gargensis Ga9.2]